MNRSLVLNASYEPLGVVSARRALILVMCGKASSIADSGVVMHSATLDMDAPSVILLNQYHHIPRRAVPLTRRALLERDRHTCAYCQRHGDTIDHVLPRSRGGQHAWDNVVVACFKCNNKKSDLLLSELGWKLSYIPKAPDSNMAATIGAHWNEPGWDEFTSPWRQHELKLAG
ncbi:MAG TPA: HNH endonuclease [Glaciihabitans sp.]|jgi:5-methylcytosine-specific restriction endonuclease McrA|nr:HNH endonuclease [Glaciihabitans sp.]